MAKHTVASLLARVAALELQLQEDRQHLEAANKILASENADLRRNLEAASDMILKLGGAKKEESSPESNKPITVVPPEKHVEGFQWTLKTVGFTTPVSEEFMSNWTLYTNQKRNWIGMVPKTVTRDTTRFCSAFNQARAARGLEGNYWRKTGIYFKLPEK